MRAIFVIFKKQPKVNNHTLGENSGHPVSLQHFVSREKLCQKGGEKNLNHFYDQDKVSFGKIDVTLFCYICMYICSVQVNVGDIS
jgi:hypothetical protein